MPKPKAAVNSYRLEIGAWPVALQRVATWEARNKTVNPVNVVASRPMPGFGTPLAVLMVTVPALVWAQQETDVDGLRLVVGHDGYGRTHGLTHGRELRLSLDGRTLIGEDTLGAMSAADRVRLDAVFAKARQEMVVEVRFHLHPDVDATLDLGGTAVSMALKSGEIWILRPTPGGTARMELATSAYLEAGRPRPRPTRQVILTGIIRDYACHIGWTLAKAQDTPTIIRDTAPADDG